MGTLSTHTHHFIPTHRKTTNPSTTMPLELLNKTVTGILLGNWPKFYVKWSTERTDRVYIPKMAVAAVFPDSTHRVWLMVQCKITSFCGPQRYPNTTALTPAEEDRELRAKLSCKPSHLTKDPRCGIKACSPKTLSWRRRGTPLPASPKRNVRSVSEPARKTFPKHSRGRSDQAGSWRKSN